MEVKIKSLEYLKFSIGSYHSEYRHFIFEDGIITYKETQFDMETEISPMENLDKDFYLKLIEILNKSHFTSWQSKYEESSVAYNEGFQNTILGVFNAQFSSNYTTLRKYVKERVIMNEIYSERERYPCLVLISDMLPSEVSKIESWLSYLLVNEPSGFMNHMLAQVDEEAIQDIIFNQLLKSPRILKTYLEV